MRPVRQVQQDIIPRREQQQDGEEDKRKGAGADSDVVEDFFVLRDVEGVGDHGAVVDGGKDDVEDDEESDVEGLTEGWDIAEAEGEGAGVICPEGRGEDEVWFYLGDVSEEVA